MAAKHSTHSNKTNAQQKRRRRRWSFAAISVLIGLGLAFMVCETGLRAYVAARGWTANCYVTGQIFFVPHSTAGYTLRPNLRLKSSTYDVTTNSHGLRGPEIQDTPPAGKRILVLGGSSVFGYLVPDGLDSCVLLQDLLNSSADSEQPNLANVQVLNAGVPGYNILQCRRRYETDLAKLKPDVVILYLGWNDSKFVIAADPADLEQTPSAPTWIQRQLAGSITYGLLRYRIFPPGAPKFAIPQQAGSGVTAAGTKRFEKELGLLIEAIRRSGAQPVISTQLMAGAENASGLDEYLGGSPEQVSVNQSVGRWICQALRAAAVEHSVELVDVVNQVVSDPTQLGDAIHLTADGHARVASVWAEFLKPKLLESADLDVPAEQQRFE